MLASAPEPLVRDVLLRDGSTLRMQAPTPVDFDDIKAFYDGLSPEKPPAPLPRLWAHRHRGARRRGGHWR
jgi:hypothetical protein